MHKKFAFLLVALTVISFGAGIARHLLKAAKSTDLRRQQITLIVYANSSFIDAYGPGAEIKKDFEKTCECSVVYVDVGTGRAAIDRLALDAKKRVDVVVGLDLLLLKSAANRVRFQEMNSLEIEWRGDLKKYNFKRFTPYDWSPMGFVYRDNDKKPVAKVASLDEALRTWPEKSMAMADPALSTVGLEWLYWLFRTRENVDSSLKQLSKLTYVVTPNWSAAYGLFKKHQVPMAFSYLTSLIYHWQVEKDFSYHFMPFSEGHPVQVEYAAVPEACWNCSVAKQFVAFLVAPATQALIAQKNYMLPVVKNIALAPAFDDLPKVKILSFEKIDEFINQEPTLIESWKKAN